MKRIALTQRRHPSEAARDLCARLPSSFHPGTLALCFTDGSLSTEALGSALAGRLAPAEVLCLAVDGLLMREVGPPATAALFLVGGPEGVAGVGHACEDDPRLAAARAVTTALDLADRPGEVPDVVWIVGHAGGEEDVLSGIRAVVGVEVPIVGLTGAPSQSVQHGTHRLPNPGCAVAVAFASARQGIETAAGAPRPSTVGTLTRSAGRLIESIDGAPAETALATWLASSGHTLAQWEQDRTPLVRSPQGPDPSAMAQPVLVTPRGDGTLLAHRDLPPNAQLGLSRLDPAVVRGRPARMVASARAGAGLTDTVHEASLLIVPPWLLEGATGDLLRSELRTVQPGVPFLLVGHRRAQAQALGPTGPAQHLNLPVIAYLVGTPERAHVG